MRDNDILVSTFKGNLVQVGALHTDMYLHIAQEPGRSGITEGEPPAEKKDDSMESSFAWIAIPEYNYRSLRSHYMQEDAEKWFMTLPMCCYGVSPLHIPEERAYREAYLGGVAKIAMDLMFRQQNYIAGAFTADLEVPSLYMARISVLRTKTGNATSIFEEDRTYHRLNCKALGDQLGMIFEIPVYLSGLQIGAAMAYVFSDMPEDLEGAELFDKQLCQKYSLLTMQEAYDKVEVWREQHPDLKAFHESGNYFL